MRWPFRLPPRSFPILSPAMLTALKNTLTRLLFFPFQAGDRTILLGARDGVDRLRLAPDEVFYATLDGHVWCKDGKPFIVDLPTALLYELITSTVPGVTRFLTHGMKRKPRAVHPPVTPLSSYKGPHKKATPEEVDSFNADILETFGPDTLGLGVIPERDEVGFITEEPENDDVTFLAEDEEVVFKEAANGDDGE